MMDIFNIIAVPLGYVLWFIYRFVTNYFVAIFIFTLLVRLLMFPLSLKSQKSQAERARLAPRLERLQKKYQKDPQKLQQKQMELYEKEGVSMTGGCLPMLIPFPILFGIYYSVLYPLQNAVHCSAEQIDLVGDKVVYRFVISDTGIGMSPEFLKHLFEPFAQANNDARSNYQGTGMGMPIVKALLKSMGGTISVKSELGRGTTFTVDLPFAINRTPEEAVEASGDAEECDICGMSILLVEDNELNTEIAQTLLEHDGALVTTAANGKEALELFQAKPAGAFDAILMDVMMPKMNGYEATRAIRLCDKPDADEVPIIAMTANAFIEDIARAKESGMNDHLSKPIKIEKLKATLAKYRVR